METFLRLSWPPRRHHGFNAHMVKSSLSRAEALDVEV
jgi:hypothetical protein